MPQVRIIALLIYVVTEGQTLLVHCSNILKSFFFFLNVLLTVYLSIFILVINQLNAQNFCFTINLFHVSTCFEHHVLIIRRSKLFYTASGIITPIGGCPVHGAATCRCDDTRGCIIQF